MLLARLILFLLAGLFFLLGIRTLPIEEDSFFQLMIDGCLTSVAVIILILAAIWVFQIVIMIIKFDNRT